LVSAKYRLNSLDIGQNICIYRHFHCSSAKYWFRKNLASNVALKSSKKDLKDSSQRFNRKIEELESKIEELKFKVMKNSEEKDIRNMKEKNEKKLKDVREREAKLKLAQNGLEQQTFSTDEKKNLDIGDDNHNLYSNPTPNLPDPNIQLSNPTRSPAILTLVPHQHLHPV
jgi:TolA-binding protein